MRKSLNGKKPSFEYEMNLWQQGCRIVVGLDEAGRGPLAGPVVAAAVWVTPTMSLRGRRPKQSRYVTAEHYERRYSAGSPRHRRLAVARDDAPLCDSKQLSASQREAWYKFLTNHLDIKWGVGIVSEKIIDRINILEATKLAMKESLRDLEKKLSNGRGSPRGEPRPPIGYLLLDGNFLLDDLNINQKAVPRGDEKIWSCAAASVIAKVTRDRLMLESHKEYPQYGFDRHKGYGTKAHFAALKARGPCAIHRCSFAPVRDCKK